jgi:hypothetical protein
MTRNEFPLERRHLGVPSGASKIISVRPKWILTLLYVWRKPCTYLAPTLTPSPNGPKQDSTWPSSPRSTIGCFQNDFWPYSMFDGNSISKRTKTRFHMSLVTQKFHRVCPKWFFSLWYIRHKPCTYLASRLALSPSPNGPKQYSTWATSARSIIGCVQYDFWPYGTFGANRAPILLRH